MSLRTKISLMLSVALIAAIAGMLPAYLALDKFRTEFAAAFFEHADNAVSAEAQVLGGSLEFAMLSMAPAAGSVCAVMIAVSLFVKAWLAAPLHKITEALAQDAPAEVTKALPVAASAEFAGLSQGIIALCRSVEALEHSATERAEKLDQNTAMFRDLAYASADWVWETDALGELTASSGRVPDFADVASNEPLGYALDALLAVPVEGDATRPLELNSRRPINDLLCVFQSADGGTRFLRLHAHPKLDDAGRLLGFCGLAKDVTASHTAERQTRELAYHDTLTGLPNRHETLNRIGQALEARAVSKAEVAVVLIQLDGFERINACFGHQTGDVALTEIAARLHGLCGPQDTLGRISEHAFVIIQSNAAQPESAEHLCLAALQTARLPLSGDPQQIEINASIGGAIADPDLHDATELLHRADLAVYQARDAGPNTYTLYSSDITSHVREQTRMIGDLKSAIGTKAIEVFYQPVVAAETRALTGFAARVRWQRKLQGTVYPDEFLKLAEDSGQIIPLSEQILRTACRTAMSWPNIAVAIKLSPTVFLHEGFLATVVSVLRESNLPSHRLELEITEASLLTSAETALFQFDALRDLGVRVVIDKFGAGTSSLQHLQQARFNKLKLDRSFVTNIDRETNAAKIVRSILQLGHALGMETAADGVSREDQATLLAKLGCQTLQGPLIGKAMSGDRAFELLRTQGIMPGAPKAERHL